MPKNDEYYMSLAIKQAKKGLGYTSPNPLVGAVIVKDNKILSKGYHEKDGEEHAEVIAINKANKKDLIGATIYVNLEPCCHYGRTPPCTNAIIHAKIKRVVIANRDVDERVNGSGIDILKKANIETRVGILEAKAKELNSIYFFNKINNRPYVVLKAALSLDARIATYKGDSKWISSEACRKIVHKLRLRLKAIAIGKNTVIKDNPQLNCRLENYHDKPIDRLIFSNNKIKLDCLAPNTGNNYVIDGNISFSRESFIQFCNENTIDSILIEGGGKIYTWFLENNLVDRIFLFYKPAFIGLDGIPVFTKTGIKFISELKNFDIIRTKIIDSNFLVELSSGEPICLLV